jgi:thiol-disulfide isomerase/thioredoxin
MTIALSVALALVQTVSSPPPAVPQAKGTTPAACVAEVREFTTTRMTAARAGLAQATTPEERMELSRGLVAINQQISKDAAAMAAGCAAKFDAATVAESELPALAELYTQAGMPDAANAAVLRAVKATSLSEPQRASALMQAIQIGLTQQKSEARNAALESYVDALDALSDEVLDAKFNAHSRMNSYYRADDIDAGIVKHSTWLIEKTKSTPALRAKYGPMAISAYENMAEAWAGQGRTDEALALLRSAPAELAGVANVAARLEPTLARYLLVGTPATAITAPRWLNGPDGSNVVDMKGHVTLLEFTAHWCGPCKESYPGIKRLLAEYGAKGFRVVFATELYGYFGTERTLSPEAEFDRDREYFKKEGLDVPVAVSDRVTPKTVDGRTVYVPDPNNAAYKVGGIPQIHLIDRQGRIRLIMVGYDDANEPQLRRFVQALLNEK